MTSSRRPARATSAGCGVPNVTYPGAAPLQRLYPGDSYVDWIGITQMFQQLPTIRLS